MKKLIAAILIPIACFAALVDLPNTIVLPWGSPLYTSPSFGLSITVNDDTDAASFIFDIPPFSGAGSLTQISFITGTVTTGENSVPIRIETLDASGNPSGTLIDANATSTVNIADADDNTLKVATLAGAVTVTTGTHVALRIKRNSSGSLNGGVFKYATSPTVNGIPAVQDYNVTGAGAWTKTGASPMVMLLIDGTWVAPLGCIGGISTGSFSTTAFASPAQVAMRIRLPMSVKAVGAKAYLTLPAGSSVMFKLYSNPTGTPTEIASTAVFDTDSSTSTSARLQGFVFTSPVTLAANTDYALAMCPQDANNLSVNYLTANYTYASAYPSGAYGTYYDRANTSSAFSETNTRIPLIGLVASSVDVSGSTGGVFLSYNWGRR